MCAFWFFNMTGRTNSFLASYLTLLFNGTSFFARLILFGVVADVSSVAAAFNAELSKRRKFNLSAFEDFCVSVIKPISKLVSLKASFYVRI